MSFSGYAEVLDRNKVKVTGYMLLPDLRLVRGVDAHAAQAAVVRGAGEDDRRRQVVRGHESLAASAAARRRALSERAVETHDEHLFSSRRVYLPCCVARAIGAAAQTIPKEKGAARTVGLFSFLCLKQLPDLDGIERAAGFGEFDQLTGDDLKAYTPQAPAEKLFAWRYHDHGERFILTAARAKPDDAFKKQMPAFANATSTACSLLVPSTKPDPLLGELTRTMGRAADRRGRRATRACMRGHTSGRNALSYVHYYAPDKAGARPCSARAYSSRTDVTLPRVPHGTAHLRQDDKWHRTSGRLRASPHFHR